MRVVHTDNAPKAVGPYSQAISVSAGETVYVSGQIPLDPATMKVAEGGIAAQTKQTLNNLKAVLVEAGCSFADVVKTTIYLTDLSDFVTVNEIYEEALSPYRPARACVQVQALPKGVNIEIDAIAVRR